MLLDLVEEQTGVPGEVQLEHFQWAEALLAAVEELGPVLEEEYAEFVPGRGLAQREQQLPSNWPGSDGQGVTRVFASSSGWEPIPGVPRVAG